MDKEGEEYGKQISNEKENQMTIDVKQNIVYLDNVPAFILMEGGKKEPVTPNGWNMYRNNVMAIDDWLITRGQRKASPSGQIF